MKIPFPYAGMKPFKFKTHKRHIIKLSSYKNVKIKITKIKKIT